MNDAFSRLSDTDLQTLVAGLRSGRVTAPYSELQVSRVVTVCFERRGSRGIESTRWPRFFSGTDRGRPGVDRLTTVQNGRVEEPPIDLVTSGPEAPGITNRDTSVVVRELFAHAKKSVLVVGYAVLPGTTRV